jgi:hypothetical protein
LSVDEVPGYIEAKARGLVTRGVGVVDPDGSEAETKALELLQKPDAVPAVGTPKTLTARHAKQVFLSHHSHLNQKEKHMIYEVEKSEVFVLCEGCGWSGTLEKTDDQDVFGEDFEKVGVECVCPKCAHSVELASLTPG